MKFASIVIAATLAFSAAGAMAHDVVDMNARFASTGNLVSSINPVSVTLGGGRSTSRELTIADNGGGYASSLNVTVTRTAGKLADLSISGDTCTGATLAPGGFCKLNLGMDGSCPKGETAAWTILITSTNAPTLSIPVNLDSTGGACK